MENNNTTEFEALKNLCGKSGEEPRQKETEKTAPEQEDAPLQSASSREEDGQKETEEKPQQKFTLNLTDQELDDAPVWEDAEQEELHSGSEKTRKKKKKSSPMKAVFYTILVIGLSVLLSMGILISLNDVFAFYKESKNVQVEIDKGSSTGQIAKKLKEHGIVQFPLLFQFVSKMSGNDGSYQYGIYNLRTDMGYDELMHELQKNAPKKDVVKITITEGMTLREVGKLLEENKICDGDKFVDTINRTKFGYRFEDQIESNPLKFYRIEGYVFPDTYEFFLGEEPASVAEKIIKNFSEKITNDIYGRMKELDMTLEETLTLASLIQAESGQSEQMRKVAGVFWNRLDHPEEYPNLQSDVTINYVEKNIKPYDKTKNQNIYDAYNTNVCKGLPVAPICNPGLEAIWAALKPESHNYYYFVTDKKGNYYYARTYAEHKKNCKAAGIPAGQY